MILNRTRNHGFSLTELLLVLAIIGIISAIAIPSLTGQRQRARMIGDAEANARILAMALEGLKAENGRYGPANATATWTPSSNTPALTGFTSNPAPNFKPQGNSQMSFVLTAQPLTYNIQVYQGGTSGMLLMAINESGAKTVYVH